jgi:hypothetical protein
MKHRHLVFLFLTALCCSCVKAQSLAELRQAVKDFTGTYKSTDGTVHDRAIEGLIQAATPQADESVRRVQRAAVRGLFSDTGAELQEAVDARVDSSGRRASQMARAAFGSQRNPTRPEGEQVFTLYWAGGPAGYIANSRIDAAFNKPDSGVLRFTINGISVNGSLSGWPMTGTYVDGVFRLSRVIDNGATVQSWTARFDADQNIQGNLIVGQGRIVPFYATRIEHEPKSEPSRFNSHPAVSTEERYIGYWAGADGYAAGSRFDEQNYAIPRSEAGVIRLHRDGSRLSGMISGWPFIGEWTGEHFRIIRTIDHGQTKQLWTASFDSQGNMFGFVIVPGRLIPFYAKPEAL